jgi:hypothetical protein
VAINNCTDVKSYTSLHTLVNDMFPPTSLVEQVGFLLTLNRNSPSGPRKQKVKEVTLFRNSFGFTHDIWGIYPPVPGINMDHFIEFWF